MAQNRTVHVETAEEYPARMAQNRTVHVETAEEYPARMAQNGTVHVKKFYVMKARLGPDTLGTPQPDNHALPDRRRLRSQRPMELLSVIITPCQIAEDFAPSARWYWCRIVTNYQRPLVCLLLLSRTERHVLVLTTS
ncbi:hypothetical protein J6590_051971 [Homalodisca vitripennis]|nr:hypothetical protein J6590_051971 [Homalodisca vitripennis]